MTPPARQPLSTMSNPLTAALTATVTSSQFQKLIASARASLGPNVILMTTDGGSVDYMKRGSLPGPSVYTVGDGCGNPQVCADAQRQFNPPGERSGI